ncbi:Hypothetical protein mma_2398 [Janthinobacterium sp. Marseille]|nr:PepSY domain-containing protein [Janthinobacterium sp. Marseille]ABR91225.1 Hypothetical protein mma_2398 [Janthinobacterium sp. Marseille]
MDKNVIKFTIVIAIIAALAFAAQAGPAAAQTTAVATQGKLAPIATGATLSYEELERRVTAQGLQIKKAEVRDLLLKVTAYDNQHRKVKMTLDRRTGEVLARKISREND